MKLPLKTTCNSKSVAANAKCVALLCVSNISVVTGLAVHLHGEIALGGSRLSGAPLNPSPSNSVAIMLLFSPSLAAVFDVCILTVGCSPESTQHSGMHDASDKVKEFHEIEHRWNVKAGKRRLPDLLL